MKRVSTTIFVLIVAVVVGGAIFLSTWDIPAPIAKVTKVLPDAKFPR